MSIESQSIQRLLSTCDKLIAQTSWLKRNRRLALSQSALLVIGEAEHRVDDLSMAVSILKEGASWLGSLNGEIGAVIAALALSRGLDPTDLPKRSSEVQKAAKQHKHLNVGGIHGASTWAYLSLLPEEEAKRALPRMSQIMSLWKKDHPWVTGTDDVFAALLHALGPRSPEQVGELTEACFQALKQGGHNGSANERQMAAQFVALWPEVNVQRVEHNYRALSKSMKQFSGWFSPNPRSAVSLLAASQLSPHSAAQAVQQGYEQLKKHVRGVSKELLLSLAAGLLILESDHTNSEIEGAVLACVVGLIYAEEVAIMAAVAAGAAT